MDKRKRKLWMNRIAGFGILAAVWLSGSEAALAAGNAGEAYTAGTQAVADEFVPSTPEMQHKGLSLEQEKAKCLQALDTLYGTGISPMAIVERLFGRTKSDDMSDQAEPLSTTDADHVPQAANAADADSARDTGSAAASGIQEETATLGAGIASKAQEAGDELVDRAGEEVEKTKKNVLSSLQESIKEAADNLVDALFSKL